MDAYYYNGDDDRDCDPEYGYQDDRCTDCGAEWNQDCHAGCVCPSCVGRQRAELAEEVA